MPGKFRFCPVCKDVSNTSARDINKLASLSGEGRSSATTILISSILQWMNGDASDLPEHTRKLLAFTDNRQELQAGHFNDFIFVTLLRAAILSALKSAPAGSLPEPEIGARIQVALGFLADGAYAHRADEWLENPGLKGQAREDAPKPCSAKASNIVSGSTSAGDGGSPTRTSNNSASFALNTSTSRIWPGTMKS